jgi:hypothetical protein
MLSMCHNYEMPYNEMFVKFGFQPKIPVIFEPTL